MSYMVTVRREEHFEIRYDPSHPDHDGSFAGAMRTFGDIKFAMLRGDEPPGRISLMSTAPIALTSTGVSDSGKYETFDMIEHVKLTEKSQERARARAERRDAKRKNAEANAAEQTTENQSLTADDHSVDWVLVLTLPFCQATPLAAVGTCGRPALALVTREALARYAQLPWERHRLNWEIPQVFEKSSLHYNDSTMSRVEGADAWETARLVAPSAQPAYLDSTAVKKQAARMREEPRRVSWQLKLFTASHPHIARALPSAWARADLNELADLVHKSTSERRKVAIDLFLAARPELAASKKHHGGVTPSGSRANVSRVIEMLCMSDSSGGQRQWVLRPEFLQLLGGKRAGRSMHKPADPKNRRLVEDVATLPKKPKRASKHGQIAGQRTLTTFFMPSSAIVQIAGADTGATASPV